MGIKSVLNFKRIIIPRFPAASSSCGHHVIAGLYRKSCGMEPSPKRMKPMMQIRNFEPRPYQVEIVEQAVKQNSIVCLATGTGKTFISAMVIKELYDGKHLPYDQYGKRIFFVVNTVPLVEQQSKVLESTSLTVGKYCGDQNVDDWPKDVWIKEFNKNDVFVMTGQILLNLILQSTITSHHIGLLVFDECHNASKNHNYNKILEVLSDERQHQPHVLGLTASIINEKYKGSPDRDLIQQFLLGKMEGLENRMRAALVTCADPEATSAYATKPVEFIKTYPEGCHANSGYEDVEEFIDKYIEMFSSIRDDYNEKRRVFENESRTHKNKGRLVPGDIEQKTLMYVFCHDAMKFLVDILETMGPLSANMAADILINALEHHIILTSRYMDETELRNGIQRIKKFKADYKTCIKSTPFKTVENVPPIEPFVTTKAYMFLNNILREEKEYYEGKEKKLHAIVFTERRITAVLLSKLINYQVKINRDDFEDLWSNTILGHRGIESVKLVDSHMTSKNQNKILRDFRDEKFNILIATSVVEEGLDVRKCNVVIRYDGIDNYRAYVQSKGRARAKDSKFIVFAKEDERADTERELKVMQEIEKILFENCHERKLPSEEEMKNAFAIEEDIPTYFANDDFNAARITKDNAVSLLHCYCSKLPRDAYSSTKPHIFETMLDKDSGMYKSTVILPPNCLLYPRRYEGKPMLGKDKARRFICMEICKKLHEIGELNSETLLPVKRKDYASDDDTNDGDPMEGTKKSRSFYNREVPRQLLDGHLMLKSHDTDLYLISMELVKPNTKVNSEPYCKIWNKGDRKCFGLLLPKGIEPIPPTLHMYIRAGKIQIDLEKIEDNSFEHLRHKELLNFHQYVINESCMRYIRDDVIFNPDFLRSPDQLSKSVLLPLFVDSSDEAGELEYHIDVDMIKNTEKHKDMKPNIGSVVTKKYLVTEAKNRRYYLTGLADEKVDDFMDGKKTFADYYLQKYDISLLPSQNLLISVPSSAKADYTDNSFEPSNNKQPRLIEKLIPDLCEVSSVLNVELFEQMKCLPFFFYGIENMLNMHNLKMKMVEQLDISKEDCPKLWSLTVNGMEPITQLKNALRIDSKVSENTFSPSMFDIWECMTTRQANFGFDLEKLEMLGDSFLKFAVTIITYFKYPTDHEGVLTTKRMGVITNKNLSRIAKSHGLQHIICNSQFGITNTDSENQNAKTVWLPPGFCRKEEVTENSMEDEDVTIGCFQEVQDKSLADCIEALIGLYLKTGGLNLVLHFMQNYLGIDVYYRQIEFEKNKLKKVIPNTSSKYCDYPKSMSAMIENTPQNKDQVLHLYKKMKMEKLEKKLRYKFNDKSHLVQALTHLSYTNNFVTGCYQQKEFLGDAILDFLVTLNIYMNKPDLSPGDLTSIRSALVNNNTFALLAIQNNFHKYVYHMSPVLLSEIQQFTGMVKENKIEQLLEHPFYIVPRTSDEGYLAPKVLGDIFESIAGAIFLDCGHDIIKVWKVLYPKMEKAIDIMIDRIPLNPVRELSELHPDLKSSDFKFSDPSSPPVSCLLKLKGKEFKGVGKNKKIAKATCCVKVLQDRENGATEGENEYGV